MPNIPLRMMGLLVLLSLSTAPALAQDPLYLVDDETTVEGISWRFVDQQTFAADRLQAQIATQAPGFFNQVRDWFDILPGIRARTYPFDPITLQKDVIRLRRFYRQNGFLRPRIDYPASQFSDEANAIRVVFTIKEGPPLIIQDAGFFQADSTGYAVQSFAPDVRDAWIRFRDRTSFRVGERFTEVNRIRIEDNVRTWLQNAGFAFASVGSEVQIDSVSSTVDLRFYVDPGPRGRVSEIQVEGNRSVSSRVVQREVPIKVGDRYSASAVADGQSQLFGLNLFRVALADLPEQSRDSSVVVRYRVREAKLRTVSGQVGYGAQTGVSVEGSWTHRNFYGSARNLTVGLIAETGFPTSAGFLPDWLAGTGNNSSGQRRFRASSTLRQPYVYSTRLSASVSPFVEERLNPNLQPDSTRFLQMNERQFGLNTTFVYEILPFRTVSVQHQFSRTEQFTARQADASGPGSGVGRETDLFDRSILSTNATLGKTNDFINPSRGFLVEPSVQVAGGLLGSDVQFVRGTVQVTGYLPLSDNVEVAGRVFAGGLRPRGTSRRALRAAPTTIDNALFENRFDAFLLYGGGGTDVRGWPPQQAGAKFVRGNTVGPDTTVYEPLGAQTKVGLNAELRLPAPGLGSGFRTAVFVDVARLSPGALNLAPSPRVAPAVVSDPQDPTRALQSDPDRWLIGTGMGLRYNTPFGFLRLDLAMKVNPDALDLRRPEEVEGQLRSGRAERLKDVTHPRLKLFGQPTGFALRRFRVHVGIGRSF